MSKKTYSYLFAIMLTGLFVCSSSLANAQGVRKPKSATRATVSRNTTVAKSGLRPATTKIKGELGACFDVVDQAYTLTENNGATAILNVKVKRNAKSLPFNAELADTYDSSEEHGYIAVAFGLEIKNAKGVLVDETTAGGVGRDAPEYPECGLKILKLKKGQIGTLKFVIHDVSQVNNNCKFTVTSAFEEK